MGLNSLGERQTSFHLPLFVVIGFMTVLRKDGKILNIQSLNSTVSVSILMSSRSLRRLRHYWQSAISQNTWNKMGRSRYVVKVTSIFPRNIRLMEYFHVIEMFLYFCLSVSLK